MPRIQNTRTLRARGDPTIEGRNATKGAKRKAFSDVSNNRKAKAKGEAGAKTRTTRNTTDATNDAINDEGPQQPDQPEEPTRRAAGRIRATKKPAAMQEPADLYEPKPRIHNAARRNVIQNNKAPRTRSRASLKDDSNEEDDHNDRLRAKNTKAKPEKRKSADETSADTLTVKAKRAKTEEQKKPSLKVAVEKTKKSSNEATSQARQTTVSQSLCSDFYAETEYTLGQNEFDVAKYTHGISVFDEIGKENVLEVGNYATDIYQRLFNAEVNFTPTRYMDRQRQINEAMRSILVDWLVEVHMKFRLAPETLYLCVNIIDRYLGVVQVERKNLQLVGVTALLVACKYEEIYPPEVRDCVYITDRAYTRQEVLDMEQNIVSRLEFKLTVPTGYPFVSRFLKILGANQPIKFAANYYMERTLQEYKFISMRQSLVAAAAVCLAWNHAHIRQKGTSKSGVPQILVTYTGFSREEIAACAQKITAILGQEVVTVSQRTLVAVKRKYDQRKYLHVAHLPEPTADGW